MPRKSANFYEVRKSSIMDRSNCYNCTPSDTTDSNTEEYEQSEY